MQWPIEKTTNNTMAFFYWPLHCLLFFLLATVLFAIFSIGHCIVCCFFYWPQWPIEKTINNAVANRKNNKQYSGQ
jgi:ABC-type protease/lipase transport system fused ATPase/permease subunit